MSELTIESGKELQLTLDEVAELNACFDTYFEMRYKANRAARAGNQINLKRYHRTAKEQMRLIVCIAQGKM